MRELSGKAAEKKLSAIASRRNRSKEETHVIDLQNKLIHFDKMTTKLASILSEVLS